MNKKGSNQNLTFIGGQGGGSMISQTTSNTGNNEKDLMRFGHTICLSK